MHHRTDGSGWLATAILAAVLAWPSRASAQDCLADARAAHESATAPGPSALSGPGCFVPRGGPPKNVEPSRPCPATATTHYYFEDEAEADAQKQSVTRLSKLGCPLFHVTGVTGKLATPAPPPKAKGGGLCEDLDAAECERLARVLDVKDPSKVLRDTREEGTARVISKGMPAAATGTGGAAQIAAEAVQILGQIVVDRASQAAYRMLGEKIKQGLSCSTDDGRRNPETRFPATCEAVDDVRIQDLAMSRDVLVRALAADVVNAALRSAPNAALEELRRTYLPLVLGTLSDPTKRRAGQSARAIVAELESLAREKATSRSASPEWQPVVLAGGALARCQVRVAMNQLTTLAECDVSREVDWFDADASAKKVGRSLARSLQTALVGKTDDTNDPDLRLIAALSGVFDATCYAVDRTKELGCPALLDVAPVDRGRVVLPLAFARGVLEAAVERDTNRMITTAVQGIDGIVLPALDPAATRRQKRALRLLAGVVAYAKTFEPKASEEAAASEEERHAQRTAILESLTADMSTRVGREGDVIASFGGSLSLVGGARLPFDGGTPVYNGPFSLSLGFGLQNVPEHCPVGWHLELGLLDLAQYLSFQAKPSDPAGGSEREIVVREPEVKDAVAPSLKLGVQWGRDVPFFLAGAVGYVPFYEFEKGDGTVESRAAFTLSGAFGAYVPLIDIN